MNAKCMLHPQAFLPAWRSQRSERERGEKTGERREKREREREESIRTPFAKPLVIKNVCPALSLVFSFFVLLDATKIHTSFIKQISLI